MPPRTHSPDSSATIAPSTSSSSTPEPPVSGGEQPKQPQQDGDSVEKQSEGKNDGSGNGTKTETETGNSKKSEEKDPNRVGFEGDDDPYNPQNLSTVSTICVAKGKKEGSNAMIEMFSFFLRGVQLNGVHFVL